MNVAEEINFRVLLASINDTTADIQALNARLDERHKLNAIIFIYDQCKDDPAAKIPTKLAIVIEAARSA